MADIIAIRRIRRRRKSRSLSREWIIQDRDNPFEMEEETFIKKFRLCKAAVRDLCDELKPHMNKTESGYSVEMKVLSSLMFLGTGSFQSVVSSSSFTQISQSTVSRNLTRFIDAACKILPHHVTFPRTSNEWLKIKEDFMLNSGFPNCVGAIDCTHVHITKPEDHDWFVFLNRKNRFSINVQMVCDSNMKILDVVARWPGGTHDAFIWKNCGLRQLFSEKSNPEKKFLLGDSGYPLEPWLMTPYLDEHFDRQKKYNITHRRARNVIERCFGVLKSRFRCLHETGGILQYQPDKVCKIIIACVVLHNICLKYNVPPVEKACGDNFVDFDEGDDELSSDIQANTQSLRNKGSQFREEISYNI